MKDRLLSVKQRIEKTALKCGRDPQDIQLVAVSKTIAKEQILTAIDLGHSVFGENYIQEAREKFNALYYQPITWHFIGHLQSNKAKYAVKMFDLIHSVDSLKLARIIDQQAHKINKVQDVLIQVNISGEMSKSGVQEEETIQMIGEIQQFNHLRVLGLMTMPPFFNAPEKVRPFFRALNELRNQIQNLNIPNVSMEELSMGMTGDFEVAIEEGATLVRIGTAIFGERQ